MLVVPKRRPRRHWIRPIIRIEPAVECRRAHSERDCGGKEGLLRESRGEPVAPELENTQLNERGAAEHVNATGTSMRRKVEGERNRGEEWPKGTGEKSGTFPLSTDSKMRAR